MHMPVGIRVSRQRHAIRVAKLEKGSTTQSTSTPVPSSGPPTVHLSTSARSLIGALTVIGAILLAVVAWKMRSNWKRRKGRASLSRFSIVYKTSAKPARVSLADTRKFDETRKTVLQPPLPSSPIAWATQVRSVKLPEGVTMPPIAVTAPSRSPKHQDGYPPTPHSGPKVSPFPSPPPAYRVLGLQSVPVPPTPPSAAPSAVPPPTPMSRNYPEPPSIPLRDSFDLPPVPSPRSASFDTSMPVPPPASTAAVFAAKPLTRLMHVSTSFQPTRDDELGVRAGETLRLLKEFEDEWCLVQRVGRPDAEKGVVPRFCLVDRPSVVKNRGSFAGLSFGGVRRK